MDKVLAWWQSIVNKANESGIPIPMARANGKASITATMVVISFAMCIIPIIIMTGTVITKLTGVFTLNDANQQQLMNAFSSSIQLYIASLGAYLGRGMQRGSDGKVIVEKASEKEEKTE
jgi:cytochrome c oxidase assembly factor CtaG